VPFREGRFGNRRPTNRANPHQLDLAVAGGQEQRRRADEHLVERRNPCCNYRLGRHPSSASHWGRQPLGQQLFEQFPITTTQHGRRAAGRRPAPSGIWIRGPVRAGSFATAALSACARRWSAPVAPFRRERHRPAPQRTADASPEVRSPEGAPRNNSGVKPPRSVSPTLPLMLFWSP